VSVQSDHSFGPICEARTSPVSPPTGANLEMLEHLGRLLDVTHDLLCVIGRDGYFQFANFSWETTLGYSEEELLARPYIELIHPDDRAGTIADAEKVMSGRPTVSFENRYLCKDGSYKWFSWAVTASLPEQLAYAAGRDITEHKRSEERAFRLAQAVEGSAELICMGDAAGRISFANQALLKASGYREDELIGKLFSETLRSPHNPKHIADEIRAGIDSEGKWRGECLQRRKDGTDFPVFLSIGGIKDNQGVVTGSLGMAQDISERRQMEQQLRQAQKMEAVGQLAGGIAHDFNNLLMVILGYAGLITDRFGAGDPLRKEADEIIKAGNRAGSLTPQLLAFSRRQVLEPKVLNLNSLIEDVKNMLGRLINEDIELMTELDQELGVVKADQGQLEQVIVNLVVNARDAMPSGGILTIKTENIDVDEAQARKHALVPPGSFVRLSVMDTGIGMDAETQSHIFEPFFTTKERGRGTGLGLATVHGVVNQSNGFIWVSSEPGHGTTFEIFLPRVSEPVQAVGRETVSGRSWKGSETILLVEDDEPLRKLILNSLIGSGYTVLEASNGVEALSIAQEISGKIDLVLTDVVMPGLGGIHVADRISALYPTIKMLFMSGYSDFEPGYHGLGRERPLLEKPFSLQNLATKLREVLERNPVLVTVPQ
jgi:two-component system, cell cycle sensor histidine kinase and response regulator CckA